jgi:hypothetical protein
MENQDKNTKDINSLPANNTLARLVPENNLAYQARQNQ